MRPANLKYGSLPLTKKGIVQVKFSVQISVLEKIMGRLRRTDTTNDLNNTIKGPTTCQ